MPSLDIDAALWYPATAVPLLVFTIFVAVVIGKLFRFLERQIGAVYEQAPNEPITFRKMLSYFRDAMVKWVIKWIVKWAAKWRTAKDLEMGDGSAVESVCSYTSSSSSGQIESGEGAAKWRAAKDLEMGDGSAVESEYSYTSSSSSGSLYSSGPSESGEVRQTPVASQESAPVRALSPHSSYQVHSPMSPPQQLNQEIFAPSLHQAPPLPIATRATGKSVTFDTEYVKLDSPATAESGEETTGKEDDYTPSTPYTSNGDGIGKGKGKARLEAIQETSEDGGLREKRARLDDILGAVDASYTSEDGRVGKSKASVDEMLKMLELVAALLTARDNKAYVGEGSEQPTRPDGHSNWRSSPRKAKVVRVKDHLETAPEENWDAWPPSEYGNRNEHESEMPYHTR